MHRSIHRARSLASLLVAVLLAAGTMAHAKGGRLFSPSSYDRQRQARRSQHASFQRAGKFSALARRQQARFKRTGNAKQKTWARQNTVRAAKQRVKAYKAKAFRAANLAKVAKRRGKHQLAAKLTKVSQRYGQRASRLNRGVSRYMSKHGVTLPGRRSSATARAGQHRPAAGSSRSHMASTRSKAAAAGTSRGSRRALRAEKRQHGSAYDKHRIAHERYRAEATLLHTQAVQTQDPGLMRKAVAAQAAADRAQIGMWRSQARSLRAKAKRTPARAAEFQNRAKALDRRASQKHSAVRKYVASARKQLPKQVADSEPVPGVDKPAASRGDGHGQQQQVRSVGTRKGKRVAKAQLKNGNISGAVATLKQMEAAGNRRGVRGLLDRYRRWSTKRKILRHANKAGRAGAKSGDFELARESMGAIEALGRSEGYKNRKFRGIAQAALTGAKRFSKAHNPKMARELLDFSAGGRGKDLRRRHQLENEYLKTGGMDPAVVERLQTHMNRVRPTLRYRWQRRKAKRRNWKDLKRRASEGNIEGFRSAMRLASAYAREDGRKPSKRSLRRVRKLYNKALKRSVVRALDDARLLVSGKLGYVNVDEAKQRMLYAQDTADALAKRGIVVRTGMFRRSVQGRFRKVRRMLVKAFQNQHNLDARRPGLLKRVFNRWFKQRHQRRPPAVAPLDSVWQEKQVAAQYGLTRGQYRKMVQAGVTPEMMAQMQQQGGKPAAGGEQPAMGGQQPAERKLTQEQVRMGEGL